MIMQGGRPLPSYKWSYNPYKYGFFHPSDPFIRPFYRGYIYIYISMSNDCRGLPFGTKANTWQPATVATQITRDSGPHGTSLLRHGHVSFV